MKNLNPLTTASIHRVSIHRVSIHRASAYTVIAYTVIACCLILLAAGPLVADSLVIANGTIHTMAGDASADQGMVGHIVLVDGKITAVGTDVEIPEGAARIDATGKHVYPGLFDAMTTLGLNEIDAVDATTDTTELGAYNPHLRAATAVHPASEIIPVSRANGITHALTAPDTGRSGVIAGQAALIHLDGWTIEEMALKPSAAMVISWPAIRTRSFDFSTFSFRETPFKEAKEEADKAQNALRDWLDAARHYAQAVESGSERVERDLKLEALANILDGKQKVMIFANAKRDLEAAVEFAEEEGLDIILVGARDAWEVKEMLAEKEIPVILRNVQSSPSEEDAPYNRPFRNAAELSEAGVLFAFSTGAGGGFGPGGPHNTRTLPYEAAMAVAYGLPRDAALRALTIGAAQIFGVDEHIGTIETGKIGNLMITDGDPLEITTAVEHVIIGGVEVSTENRHRSLYERYRAR